MHPTRRQFLHRLMTVLPTASALAALPSFALASSTPARTKALIVVFLRGAVDGLNVVVPYGDPDYYASRRTLALAKPRQDDGVIDLDGQFGLHPALAPLLPAWRDQRLVAVHACGSPDPTRSHFDAQDYMETATPGVKSTRDGWLNRLLRAEAGPALSPFRGVAMSALMPRALSGREPAVAMTDLRRFSLSSGAAEQGLEALWEAQSGGLSQAGTGTFEALRRLEASGALTRPVSSGVEYPRSRFGQSLRQLAQLVTSDIGLEVGFVDAEGWDTHVNQGNARVGALANGLRDLGAGLAAFDRDLGRHREQTLVLVMSEFGRTVRENGSRGTDHGHGNVMLLLGDAVRGGRVAGEWPGLAADRLHDGRDLAITTDFRSVLAEVVERFVAHGDLAHLFPGFAVDASHFAGVIR
jgi:uncharacterized protein (DUF1501 family)